MPHLLQRTPAPLSHDCVVPCTTSSSYLRDGMVSARFTFPLIFIVLPTSMSGTMVIDLRSLAPYDGPFRVIRHQDKCFTLDINGKLKEVIVDCLKAAKLTPDHDILIGESPGAPSLLPSSFNSHSPALHSRDHACCSELTAQDEALAHHPTMTKTGRVIRRPAHLAYYLTDW